MQNYITDLKKRI